MAYSLAESGVYTRLLGGDLLPDAFEAEVLEGPLTPWLEAPGPAWARDDRRVAAMLWRGLFKTAVFRGDRRGMDVTFWRAAELLHGAEWTPFAAGLWGDRALGLLAVGGDPLAALHAQKLAWRLGAESGSRRRALVEAVRTASLLRRLGDERRAEETLDVLERSFQDLLQLPQFERGVRDAARLERAHLRDGSTAPAETTSALT